MSVINVIPAIAAITLGTVAGLYHSLRLKSKEELLREMTRLMREMALLIRHRALPVKDMFAELSQYKFISMVGTADGDFRQSWYKATENLTELDEAERSLIHTVGRSLGASDTAGQLSMLEVNAQLMSQYVDEAHQQYSQKGKFYRTFGVLAGLFFAVLIL